jgi:hypothetical protein
MIDSIIIVGVRLSENSVLLHFRGKLSLQNLNRNDCMMAKYVTILGITSQFFRSCQLAPIMRFETYGKSKD